MEQSPWLVTVQQRIADSEYQVREDGDGFRVTNRANGLRALWAPDGAVSIHSRDSVADALLPGLSSWQLDLRTRSWGRPGSMSEIQGAARLGTCSAGDRVDEHGECLRRVEIESPGLLESWENRPDGLEQLWEVSAAPTGEGPLAIELSIGQATVALHEDHRGAALLTGTARIRYHSLRAWDANGRPLDTWIEAGAHRLVVQVDDTSAIYPVLVDPLVTPAPSWAQEAGQGSSEFGHAVAAAGDVNGDGFGDVLVGAQYYDDSAADDGKAFLYLGSATGLATSTAWTASSSQGGALFGISLAGAGDVNGDGLDDVVVGAAHFDDGETNEGRAYLFRGTTTGLTSSATWVTNGNQDNAKLGLAVSGAGDVNDDQFDDVIVGAGYFDGPLSDEGQAWVFLGSGTGLSTSADWSQGSGQASSYSGNAVASAGDINGDDYDDIIVGASHYDNGETDEGVAFVYLGSASGPVSPHHRLLEVNDSGALFGGSVASAGDVDGDGFDDVIVGAQDYDSPQVDEGGAFLFRGSAGGLASTPIWTGESNQEGADYGESVASAGDVNGDGRADVIVGARYYDDLEPSEGAAFVYLGTDVSPYLTALPVWVGQSDVVGARYGSSVASAGDVNGDGRDDVVVGAPQLGNGGTAYLYYGTGAGVGDQPVWGTESGQAGAELGRSVSGTGDVNGDGFADVAIGAPYYDDGHTDEGKVFVFHGSPSGLGFEADWDAQSDQDGAALGYAVAGAGDLDGDGYSDLVAGAPWQDSDQADEGVVWVWFGSAGGLGATPTLFEETQASAFYGGSVASAGDVDGDGFSDLLVGAWEWSGGETNEGKAFLYLGGDPLDVGSDWSFEADEAEANCGRAVGSAGDVDGDGRTDVVIGCPMLDAGGTDRGSAFVFHGLAASPWLPSLADQTVSGDLSDSRLGWAVAGLGDVNADGYADLAVGAPGYGLGENFEGAISLYLGSGSGISASPTWFVESNQSFAELGGSVASAGDVNGDGWPDLVAGAVNWDSAAHADAGAAFVYLGMGEAPWLTSTEAWSVEGADANELLGKSVSGAGDVDGDGFADVLIGAQGYTNGQSDEGAAFLHMGGGSSLEPDPTWINAGDPSQSQSSLGYSVAAAGDFNGDGYDDVVVGAPYYSEGEDDEGRAFAFEGTATGLSTSACWSWQSDQVGARAGFSVASAGDVNGDGFADVLVGSQLWDSAAGSDAGRADLFLGADGCLTSSAAWELEGDQIGASLGAAVASAGDVDGDGYDDFLVGVPGFDAPSSGNDGQVLVFAGSATGPETTPTWTLDAGQGNSGMGWSVASAGDTDGDGFSDVIVGLWDWDGGESDEGAAWVYLGSGTGLASNPAWEIESDQVGAHLGVSVASAGDVNGDRFSDVIVGAHTWTGAAAGEGAAFVYLGSSTGLASVSDSVFTDGEAGAQLGQSVASAGDVNGDGYADVVYGAPHHTGNEGRAWLHLGSASGLAAAASSLLVPDQGGGLLGWSVAPAGDVNADGFSDVLVGVPSYTLTSNQEGAAFLYLGNGADGAPAAFARLPQALQPSTGEVLSPGLHSDSHTSFDTVAVGRSPFGRTGVKLQVEVKPRGTSFDGVGFIESSSWVDTGLAGSTLQETVDGLSPATDYHWRARVLHDPADAPVQLWSPWLYGGAAGHPEGVHVATSCPDADGDGLCDGEDDDDDDDGDPDTTDCVDDDPTIYNGAPEIADDAIDQDCDGFDTVTCFVDGDGDSYGDTATLLSPDGDCTDAGESTVDTDCDDSDPSVHPAATEVCNAVDDDCDTDVDEGFDVDGDGHTTCSGDCEDADPTVFPGAPESCDAVDSDCDTSLVDEFVDTDSDLDPDCTDPDDDGDGDPDATDCAPLDDTIHAGATEYCDAVDSDCDGSLVDEFDDTDSDLDPDCTDPDDDGDGDPDATDCADLDDSVYSGALESCDTVDSDCDGSLVDEFDDTDGDLDPDCTDPDDDGDLYLDVTDCGPLDSAIYPNAPESCDGVDSDCDGSLADEFDDTDSDDEPDCVDLDDDGDGDPDASDCAPLDDTVHAGATEACDALDQDCDGSLVDEFDDTDSDGDPDCTDPDDDGDGDPDVSDCDDGDANVYTGAPETCDGVDSDCDADLVDEFDDTDGDDDPDCTDPDDDGDGDPDLTDCAPLDPAIHAGAVEIEGDGIDQNCDGLDAVTCFVDGDGDGFGGSTTVVADDADCDDPGESSTDDDCDDADPAAHPGASETPDDGVDQDCDGFDVVTCFVDGDGDGYGSVATVLAADGDCTDPGESTTDTDCDDADAAVHPTAIESCDTLDSNCDGDLVDGFDDWDGDGDPDCTDPDDDDDGFLDTVDCDPPDQDIHPGADESCDWIDSDCDGDLVDEFIDTDGDGIPDCVEDDTDEDGDPDDTDCAPLDDQVFHGAEEVCDGQDNDCDPGTDEDADLDGDGFSLCDGDCDDDEPAVYPDAFEFCDGLDNDCDPDTLEDDADADGDGQPVCDGDCDDDDPLNFDGNDEACDGQDNDCDDEVDEDLDLVEYLADEDGDGYGDDAIMLEDCQQPEGYVEAGGDCDDADPAIHPGAEELCDGLDNDCDPATDLDGADVDADGDGVLACEDDCDDSDPGAYPGAAEACEDDIDQDCDGAEADGTDPECWSGGCSDCANSVAPRSGPGWLLGLAVTLVGLSRRRRVSGPRRSSGVAS